MQVLINVDYSLLYMPMFPLKHIISCVTGKYLNTQSYFLRRWLGKALGSWICWILLIFIRGGLESKTNLCCTEDPSSK